MGRMVLLLFLSTSLAPAEDFKLTIPPVKTSVSFDNQPIAILASGVITGKPNTLENVFRLRLTADMADLQQHIAEVLKTQLDTSERCGDRLSVTRATLVPAAPGSTLTAYMHYERWLCAKVLGKEMVRKLIGGDGVIPVTLTPSLEGNEVKLTPEVGTIEAKGAFGEVLKSGAVRDRLRDKIHDSILAAMREGTNLKSALPPGLQRVTTIQSVRFGDSGSGGLVLELAAEIRLSAAEIRQLFTSSAR